VVEWEGMTQGVGGPPLLDTILIAALIRTVRRLPSLLDLSLGAQPDQLGYLENILAKRLLSDFPIVPSKRWEEIEEPYHPLVSRFFVTLKASESLKPDLSQFPAGTRKLGMKMAAAGLLRGWKILAFYLRRLPDSKDRELDIFALASSACLPRSGEKPMDLVTKTDLSSVALECAAAVLTNLEPAKKMVYVLALIDRLRFVHPDVEISVVCPCVEHAIGMISDFLPLQLL
jgi:hypothetical protein